jgi:hypothetical protein
MKRQFRTEPIGNAEVLCESMIGRYRVQVIWSNGPCYRVLVELGTGYWEKIRCWNERDERIFPRRAAWRGTELVRTIKAQEGIR